MNPFAMMNISFMMIAGILVLLGIAVGIFVMFRGKD